MGGDLIMQKRRFIEINQVKVKMPDCYGVRCNFDGGYCIGCTVYTGCAKLTEDHEYCVSHKLIPEENY